MTDEPDEGVEHYEDDYRDPEPEPAPPAQEAPRKRAARQTRAEVPAPITEVEIPQALHGEVRFTRSVKVGQSRDDQAHFGLTLQFTYQPGMRLEEVAALAADTFFTCKSVVFEEANLPFTITDGGVVHEVLAEPKAKARRRDEDEEEEKPRRSRRQESPRGDDDESDYDDDDDRPRRRGSRVQSLEDMDRPKHIKPATWRSLIEDPDDWWDNRPKKKSGDFSSRSPDFKHRDTDEAIWLTPPKRGGR